jgi:hypothetical protein
MNAFIRRTRSVAERLEQRLEELATPTRIALLHYSPTQDTLQGERLGIYPFLGSYLLGQAIDRAGADLVFHRHAHKGTERARYPEGYGSGTSPSRSWGVRSTSTASLRSQQRQLC